MQKPLRIKDLATRLGVTRQTVHNMLNDGRIPVKPISGTKPRLFCADDVEAWLSVSEKEAE